jgi:hypothetical protein
MLVTQGRQEHPAGRLCVPTHVAVIIIIFIIFVNCCCAMVPAEGGGAGCCEGDAWPLSIQHLAAAPLGLTQRCACHRLGGCIVITPELYSELLRLTLFGSQQARLAENVMLLQYVVS